MIITSEVLSDQARSRNDGRDSLRIRFKQSGKEAAVFHVHDGEPEDNKLSRNFRDCYDLPSLFAMVYEAGKKGEEIEFIRKETEI